MKPLTIAQRSYACGRRAEIRATAGWLDAFVEDVADLIGFVFLDGCAYMGADMDEVDEERGAAALEARERYREQMQTAVLARRGALRGTE